MSELIVHLSDDTFENDVLKSPVPVLVDFWADWCGPCKSFAPTLQAFAQECGDTVLVAKVDVDQARRTAAQLQIRAVPTIAVFSQGKESARHVGGMTVPALHRLVSVTA